MPLSDLDSAVAHGARLDAAALDACFRRSPRTRSCSRRHDDARERQRRGARADLDLAAREHAGPRRSRLGRSTYTRPVRVPLWTVGATTRTLPLSVAPSAVVTRTVWPTFKSRMRASGTSPRHSMRPWRSRRSISPPACAIWPDGDGARGDHAVVGRDDARVSQLQLGGGEIGLRRLRRARAPRALRSSGARVLRRTRRPSHRATRRGAGSRSR